MLRLTPGALSSHPVDQRPASLPTHLYVHGGRSPTAMEAMVFLPEGPFLMEVGEPGPLLEQRRPGVPIWLRVRGLADPGRIAAMLAALGVPKVLAPPLLEAPQRPQVDCLEDVILVVLHRLALAQDPAHLVSDQVALLLLPGLLITVEEAGAGSPFPDLTQWLLSREARLEDRDLDDILHFLVDDILDDLFPILERTAQRLEELEERVLRRPSPRILSSTVQYRANLRTIRTQIWPLRQQIRVLLRERLALLGPEARGGFEEMGEIVELLFENCEVLRSQCDAITQAYAATVSNRMNQVMKTLTILTSIFAPLTFIAGIYGMNFEHMPELRWRGGYPGALAVMGVVGMIQLIWLWRRGWFRDWTADR
jgi:magnesium transporter